MERDDPVQSQPLARPPFKIDLLRVEFRQIGYIQLSEQKFAARPLVLGSLSELAQTDRAREWCLQEANKLL